MRDAETVHQALNLAEQGTTATEIARRLEIPRSTVRTWLLGAVPRCAEIASRNIAVPRCTECASAAHEFGVLPHEYVYLLGLYLGDGCVATCPRGVYRLRVCLDAIYPGIVDECEAAILAVLPTNRVGRTVRGGGFENSHAGSSIEVSSYWRGWPCLLPQHGPGRKHERTIVLVDWQRTLVERHPEALLRGLIHSDGCRFINTGTNWRHPRYAFSNRSADIRAIFRKACDHLGVRWTEAPHTVYVSRKDDVAVLDRHIGPKH